VSLHGPRTSIIPTLLFRYGEAFTKGIPMNHPIQFSTSVALKRGSLVISYRVENQSAKEIYLTNHGVRIDPQKGQIPDRSAVFVYLLEKEKIVHITKRRPSPPKKLVAQVLMHFITQVTPGGVFSEDINIPLPIEANIPYEDTRPPFGSEEVTEFRLVQFSVGYIEGSSFIRAAASEYGGEKVLSIVPALDERGKPVPIPHKLEEKYLFSPTYDLKIPVRLWK